jgi:hypothetical protein
MDRKKMVQLDIFGSAQFALPTGKMRKRFFLDNTFDPISSPSTSIRCCCDMPNKVINIQITIVVIVVGVMFNLLPSE